MMGCMRGHDFKEGIRALLIDKDNNPQWNPREVQSVTPQQIDSYFTSLHEHELTVS